MRGSRELLCGISYQQIVDCAGMSQRQAAERLGVNYDYFCQVVKRNGCQHWFDSTSRKPTITPEDVANLAAQGCTQLDAATLIGMNYQNFCLLVKRWKLRHLFPSTAEASVMGRDSRHIAHVHALAGI